MNFNLSVKQQKAFSKLEASLFKDGKEKRIKNVLEKLVAAKKNIHFLKDMSGKCESRVEIIKLEEDKIHTGERKT